MFVIPNWDELYVSRVLCTLLFKCSTINTLQSREHLISDFCQIVWSIRLPIPCTFWSFIAASSNQFWHQTDYLFGLNNCLVWTPLFSVTVSSNWSEFNFKIFSFNFWFCEKNKAISISKMILNLNMFFTEIILTENCAICWISACTQIIVVSSIDSGMCV